MKRLLSLSAVLALSSLPLQACSSAAAAPAPSPTPAAGQQAGARGPGARNAQEGPKAYDEVITEKAHTKDGVFKVHMVDQDLFFEIPDAEMGKEMLLIGRHSESTVQDPGGFFGGGARLIVQWERTGNRVVLRQKEYDVIADTTAAIWRQVSTFRKGPVLSTFDVATFARLGGSGGRHGALPVQHPRVGARGGHSAEQELDRRLLGVPGERERRGHPVRADPPGAQASRRPQSQTVKVHFSMRMLPDEPMMPRWHDERVGFNSSRSYDFTRPDNRLEQVRFIHRFKLEKKDPDAALSDPVEPIVYWIDPATPEWLKPWIKVGVDKWQEAFEKAGFSNAIFGRIAPTAKENPDFSLYDARHSAIYWRPSTVANATGGQVVDPRSGQILKGEVNMYHNIMQLQKYWYFIQVAPLDERAQSLPLPDSLMGRLVEYVVTHEIGHSIGFPHNMKSSAMYPADSLRSRSFLERMGGHVATLMDYSRFNYVAQPEDNIPPELLIPKIGPYDHFAVKWGYSPIPGASTPDEERATLETWTRQQDDMPWLRFTTADSNNDPENLTEAVGDADAVQSTTYGMLNLGRVMDMMLGVAEKPGESYDELEALYGQAVGQWGRYMGHVAAIVGGAYTQQKYGTGPRFTPLERERQREAVQYLNTTAFRVPNMFLDDAILRRIEPNGVVTRFRTQQQRVLNSLLSQARLERLVEFEAMAERAADAYTMADLMSDLRVGVWGEFEDGSVRIDAYRRNMQRAFLDVVDQRLHPSEEDLNRPATPRRPAATPPWGSDIRGVMRAELEDIDDLAEGALGRAGDGMTRIHLRDIRAEIARILKTDR
jgi:hypothetical protein